MLQKIQMEEQFICLVRDTGRQFSQLFQHQVEPSEFHT